MMNLRCIARAVCILAVVFLSIPDFALGESFPTRPISLLIPYAPGGVTDLTAKCLAEIATEMLGQPVVTINKAGGGGIIAQSIAAKEKPDGYTIAVTSDSAFTQIPQMREVSFNPLTDFEFIIGHMQNPGGIVCRSEREWKSMKDLISYSRTKPGELTYGCAGTGGAAHIATEWILIKENISWRMVPFQGTAKLTPAVLGGHVDVGCSDFPVWKALIKAGQLRALAVEGILRDQYPGVPTFEELGYELPMGASFGIIAPKNTPAPIMKRLQDVLSKAMKDPRYAAVCDRLGCSRVYSSGQDYFARIKKQYELRGKVLEKLGLKKK